MREGRKLGRMIYTGLIVLSVIVALFTIRVRMDSARGGRGAVFGYIPTVVISGSMIPTLQINSVSIVRECAAWEVTTGDIIVFWEDMLLGNVIHRVVEVKTENGVRKFVTKGDNNPTRDFGYVTEDMLVGKVVYTANWMAPVMSWVTRKDGAGIDYGRAVLVVFPVIVAVWSVLCVLCWLIKKALVGLGGFILRWIAFH